jgi:cytochrome c553
MSEAIHVNGKRVNGEEKRHTGFSNAWGFAVVCALTTILLIAFGVGFLLLPAFQQGHRTSISSAARRALGFDGHDHKHMAMRLSAAGANEIPTLVVWSEATIHTARSGDAARGEFIAISCTACHGERGISQQGWIPTIAGINGLVIYKQLADFRSQARLSGPMSAIAQCLSEKDAADLAAYFSVLPGVQKDQSVRAPKLGTSYRPKDPIRRLIFAGDPKRGIAGCATCHGPGSYRVGAPVLNGQNAAYTEQQLNNFAQGSRRNDMNMPMRTIAAMLSSEEIHQLALMLASGR